ncbi:uncharacterized protein [Asterias amurensis]|uniref:uncharacterized protein isoform X2 n=1 Tax=Asterias amurensis TaxID=7602 RepID=UPI003AB24915
MAGKKKPKIRSKGKSKKPMAHIGSALFPRAMFAAVPRSPEPPEDVPEERPLSALSSALLNASLLGRVIATPPDNNTLKSTGELGASRTQEGNVSMENSMARSSMYDYYDSEEEEGEDMDQGYEDPGYSSIPLNIHQKRNTISSRAKLATPSHSDSMHSSDDDDEEDGEESAPPSERRKEQMDSSSQQRFYHTLEKGEAESLGEEERRRGKTADLKKSKEILRKETAAAAKDVEDIYSRSSKHKKKKPTPRLSTDLSESSSLTMVTSPQEDDFSDLITPPPPWKQKSKKKKKGKLSPDRLTEEDLTGDRMTSQDFTDGLVAEPIIQRVDASNTSAMKRPSPVPAPRSSSQQNQDDLDSYSHIQRPGAANSRDSQITQEEDYLRRTNSRLEKELDMVQKERSQLLETLQQQAQTQSMLQGSIKNLSPPPHHQRRMGEDEGAETEELRAGMKKLSFIKDDMERRLDEMHQLCDKLRLENQAIKEVNDRLHSENKTLRNLSESIRDEDHTQGVLMRQHAEEVVTENDQLKTIIHKLNIQLSRYQAKYSPPGKDDAHGLPSRGRTPRWLTETKYLSPLILAYEEALKEKDEVVQMTHDDLNRLRRSAEEVIHENQRLHMKLEQVGQPSSVTPAEWHRIQEHARLVLEENQVVLSQLEVLQQKQKEMQKAHSIEVSKLSKCLAMEEAEKGDLEAQLTDAKHRYSALKQQHNRFVVDAETKMPIQEHMSSLAEYKRALEEEQHKHQSEMQNVMMKLSSIQGERKSLSMKMADSEAEKSQMQGEIRAMNRAQKKHQHTIGLLKKELEHSENKLALANQHLNKVLEIAEQTSVERDSLAKVAKSQEQEKKKAVNKLLEGNVTIGRLEEKLKSYRSKADHKLGNLSSRMQAQDSTHSSQLREYEREMSHLKVLLQEKQDSLDSLASDKRKVEDQLETVWQTATSDNRRMKAKLQKSLKVPHRENGSLGGAFDYESDNRGLISSESD